MPIWWHTSHWRRQYPWEGVSLCNFDMQSLRNTKSAKVEKSYVLCPPYAGPRKGGRPREEKRIKGGVELVMEKKMNAEKKIASKRKGKPVEPDIELQCKKLKKTGKRGKTNATSGDNGQLHSTAGGAATTATAALCVGDNVATVGDAAESDDENILLTELATPKKAKTGMKGNKKKKSSVITSPQRKKTMPARGGA